MTDEQIMKQVSAGDIQRMSVLFERYQIQLYNYFMRITYDGAASEDLTMTVFERMIKYRQSYKNLSTFKSWMFQIARNAKADYFKQRKLRRADDIDQVNLEIEDMTISESWEENEKLKNLEKALANLKTDHREVLMLTRFQKMKYADVALLFNCAEGTIKAKVHRAIKELREIYLKLDAV